MGKGDVVRGATLESTPTTGTLLNLALEFIGVVVSAAIVVTPSVAVVVTPAAAVVVAAAVVTAVFVVVAAAVVTAVVVVGAAVIAVVFIAAAVVVAFVGAAVVFVVPVLFVLGNVAFNDTRDQSTQVFSPQHVYFVWILSTIFLAS